MSLVFVNPETDAVIDVDIDSAFMRRHVWDGKTIPAGGLPVRGGFEIIPVIKERVHKVFPKRRRYRTIDRHRKGHVSWHTSFIGYQPKSVLTLPEVRLWTPSSHRIAPHARFTLPQLRDYLEELERQGLERDGKPGAGIQVLWDEHADPDTQEGQLHPALPAELYAYVQEKGLDDCCDSYSGLRDNLGRPTGLGERIIADGVENVFVDGLAWDFCVRWTAINAKRDYKFRNVYVILDATAAVDLPGNDEVAGSVAKTVIELTAAGVQFVTTDQLRLITKPF